MRRDEGERGSREGDGGWREILGERRSGARSLKLGFGIGWWFSDAGRHEQLRERERERERSGMFEVSESGERGKMKGIREGAAVSIKEIMATASFDLSFSCS